MCSERWQLWSSWAAARYGSLESPSAFGPGEEVAFPEVGPKRLSAGGDSLQGPVLPSRGAHLSTCCVPFCVFARPFPPRGMPSAYLQGTRTIDAYCLRLSLNEPPFSPPPPWILCWPLSWTHHFPPDSSFSPAPSIPDVLWCSEPKTLVRVLTFPERLWECRCFMWWETRGGTRR